MIRNRPEVVSLVVLLGLQACAGKMDVASKEPGDANTLDSGDAAANADIADAAIGADVPLADGPVDGGGGDVPAAIGKLSFSTVTAGPGFSFLGWDSEGGTQARLNLLRATTAGPVFQVDVAGTWSDGASQVRSVKTTGGVNVIRLGAAGNPELTWQVEKTATGMRWSLTAAAGAASTIRSIRLTLPFNPRQAAVSVLPGKWLPPDGFAIPAVLSAADVGQLLITQEGGKPVVGRYTGSRKNKIIDVAFEIPVPSPGASVSLDFAHTVLPTPTGVDPVLWRKIRRGWWNVYEPNVAASDLGALTSVLAPAGVLSNNPISDPVSSLYAFMADHALLVPQLAPGVSAEYLLRNSLDYWLDQGTGPTGTVVSYGDITYELDAPTSVLIAAWACLEMSGDPAWISGRIALLERIADFLISSDVDDDGIIESPHSGTPYTLAGNDRGSTCWDAVNTGHKEIYTNALAYRAFRAMAAVETKLKRPDQAMVYAKAASRLKGAFPAAFSNPVSGKLAWWIDSAGTRHEYDAPGVLGLPIAYGLLPVDNAKAILAQLDKGVVDVGFTRLDLGVPTVLGPIRRGDYLQGVGVLAGEGQLEDGSDAFHNYLNGGCLVFDQIHWLNAHFRLLQNAAVAPQITAMMERQSKPVYPNGGSYQNGIVDAAQKGAEFFSWDGSTTGYEGHLVYSFFFLQAALTSHPEYFNRLYSMLDP